MKILIDADACPVVRIVQKIAKEKGVPLLILCDTNHVFYPDFGEVVTVGAGADAVDYALISRCEAGDIVVTQDYGVAAMALSKKAFVIHQSGMEYTEQNIDGLLNQRHVSKKARMASSKNHFKGPKKRTAEDDRAFEEAFLRLLES